MKNGGLHMDTPNNRLDDQIAFALETESIINAARKKQTWEKLQAKASKQVILAPYAIPPRRVAPPPGILENLTSVLARCLSFLFTDEAGYQRAANSRYRIDKYHFVNRLGPEQVMHFHATTFLQFKMV
jgi:hypothetical protein